MAGGKETKVLVELGKAVAVEIASGQVGEATRAAYAIVGATPRLVLPLIDLAVAELRKRRPDDDLIEAFMTLFGSALEVIRLEVESGQPKSSNILAALRVKLVGLAQQGDIDPTFFLMLSRQFSAAKLDMGDVLKGLLGSLIGNLDLVAEAEGDEVADLEAQLADLALAFGEDPFALAGEFMETTAVMPDEHKVAMASAMATSATATARDAAIGWLFDPSPDVRAGVAGVLAEAARSGAATPASARRLVAIRNWVPQPERGALDAAIEASRRVGVIPTTRAQAEVTSVHLSGFDGSGAQSSFVILKVGRKFAIVSLLFKLGFGIRDAWVRRDLTKAETREFIAEAAAAFEFYPGTMTFIKDALPHFLAMMRAGGAMPPFKLLDAVEVMGLDIVNPAPLPLDELLARLARALAIDASIDRQAVLDRSERWPSVDHVFMGSWYEAGPGVASLFKEPRLSGGKRIDLVMTKLLPSRARGWAEHLAWSAYALLDGGRADDARDLTIVAQELADGRPVSDIPLMRTIAELTVQVFRMDRI